MVTSLVHLVAYASFDDFLDRGWFRGGSPAVRSFAWLSCLTWLRSLASMIVVSSQASMASLVVAGFEGVPLPYGSFAWFSCFRGVFVMVDCR